MTLHRGSESPSEERLTGRQDSGSRQHNRLLSIGLGICLTPPMAWVVEWSFGRSSGHGMVWLLSSVFGLLSVCFSKAKCLTDVITPSRSVRPSLCRLRHHVAVGQGWRLLYRLRVVLDRDSINQIVSTGLSQQCCMNPFIQLHNSRLRPAAHGRDFENYLSYVMEIEEKELDTDWWGSRAMYVKSLWMDLYAGNCRPKPLKRDGPTSFIAQIMCTVVNQQLGGLEAVGWKLLSIDTMNCLSRLTVSIMCTIVKHPMTFSMSLRWASMEHQQFQLLPLLQSMGCIDTSFERRCIGHLHWQKEIDTLVASS